MRDNLIEHVQKREAFDQTYVQMWCTINRRRSIRICKTC